MIERRKGEQFAAVREPGYKGTGAVMVSIPPPEHPESPVRVHVPEILPSLLRVPLRVSTLLAKEARMLVPDVCAVSTSPE